MKTVLFVCATYFILFANSMIAQDSVSQYEKEIDQQYFFSIDHSSYIKLVLFKGGEFVYIYKFEMLMYEYQGMWKRTKSEIILFNIIYENIKPPNLKSPKKPVRKWFVSDNRICSNKNEDYKKGLCLYGINE